ncbi:hypothetical protein G7Y89_g14416 [Cudoniella acicularis]|uniref:Uncharacterized protein n=1 Tax=Cudoniella acicularis TaxID=354080 RepID=A0A8H4VVK9_9HELO|nr:hypothetical protein G7Y89_g14416 [Cudoniella acicularis]
MPTDRSLAVGRPVKDWLELTSKPCAVDEISDGTALQLCDACIVLLQSLPRYLSKRRTREEAIAKFQDSLVKLQIWRDGFGTGELETVLTQSRMIQCAVLQHLMSVAKVLKRVTNQISDSKVEMSNIDTQVKKLNKIVEDASIIIKSDENESDSDSSDFDSDDEVELQMNDDSLTPSLESGKELEVQVVFLMNLLPSIQHFLEYFRRGKDEKKIVKSTFSPPQAASAYINIVREKFTRAEDELVERLGAANWERHLNIRRKMVVCEENVISGGERVSATKSLFRPISTFYDSALGTSMAAPTVADTVSRASHSSFRTSATEGGAASLRVPEAPQEVQLGLPFICYICNKRVGDIKNRLEWKIHVFQDLEAYICTFPNCQYLLATFQTREKWAAHELSTHRKERIWTCPFCSAEFSKDGEWTQHITIQHVVESSGTDLQRHRLLAERLKDRECPLCFKSTNGKPRDFVAHVGKHMEAIALTALPKESDSDREDSSDFQSDEQSNEGVDPLPYFEQAKREYKDKAPLLNGSESRQRPRRPKTPSLSGGLTSIRETYAGRICIGTIIDYEPIELHDRGTIRLPAAVISQYPELAASVFTGRRRSMDVGIDAVINRPRSTVAAQAEAVALLPSWSAPISAKPEGRRTGSRIATEHDFERILRESEQEAKERREKYDPLDHPTISSGVSGYWSVQERDNLPLLLKHFGTDWNAIAEWMTSKTAAQVESYYLRSVNQGNEEWEAVARETDEKRERGEEMDPIPIPRATRAQLTSTSFKYLEKDSQTQRAPSSPRVDLDEFLTTPSRNGSSMLGHFSPPTLPHAVAKTLNFMPLLDDEPDYLDNPPPLIHTVQPQRQSLPSIHDAFRPKPTAQPLPSIEAFYSPFHPKTDPYASPHPTETPAKKQSKWSAEEDALIIDLRGSGMMWEDISKRLPGRSALSCRLHYQNYLESVSASLPPAHSQLPYSQSQGPPIPRSYLPSDHAPYSTPVAPSQPRQASPPQPVHPRSNPFARPEPPPSSLPDAARYPSFSGSYRSPTNSKTILYIQPERQVQKRGTSAINPLTSVCGHRRRRGTLEFYWPSEKVKLYHRTVENKRLDIISDAQLQLQQPQRPRLSLPSIQDWVENASHYQHGILGPTLPPISDSIESSTAPPEVPSNSPRFEPSILVRELPATEGLELTTTPRAVGNSRSEIEDLYSADAPIHTSPQDNS